MCVHGFPRVLPPYFLADSRRPPPFVQCTSSPCLLMYPTLLSPLTSFIGVSTCVSCLDPFTSVTPPVRSVPLPHVLRVSPHRPLRVSIVSPPSTRGRGGHGCSHLPGRVDGRTLRTGTGSRVPVESPNTLPLSPVQGHSYLDRYVITWTRSWSLSPVPTLSQCRFPCSSLTGRPKVYPY